LEPVSSISESRDGDYGFADAWPALADAAGADVNSFR
jgi:hypothetical protein